MISTGGGGADDGNITVSQPITWATPTTLTLNADNNIAINAAITGTGLSKGLILAAGTTTATGSITISAPINVNTFSAVAGSSGTINLNSGTGAVVTTNGGGQSYGSPVVLQAAANVVDTLNGAVTFSHTVDGTTAGGQALTVTAGTGTVTFGGAVGGNVALSTLSVTGPTTLAGNVTTTGAQTYNSAVTLGATATMTTSNNAVDFASTVNAATAGVQGLTVAAGNATVAFNDVVGGTAALASLTVTGPTTLARNVTTTGAQTYNSAVTLGSQQHSADHGRGDHAQCPGGGGREYADAVLGRRRADAEWDRNERRPRSEYDWRRDAGRRDIHHHRRRQSVRVPGGDHEWGAHGRSGDEVWRDNAGHRHLDRQQPGQWRPQLQWQCRRDGARPPRPGGNCRERVGNVRRHGRRGTGACEFRRDRRYHHARRQCHDHRHTGAEFDGCGHSAGGQHFAQWEPGHTAFGRRHNGERRDFGGRC